MSAALGALNSATPEPIQLRNARWYAVSTQASSENRARLNLERQGWETYFPRVSKTIRSGRRVKTELRALFPGYLFVALDLRYDRWRSVDGTFGVRSVVKAGDFPSAVPPGVIEALMEMTDEAGRVIFTPELKPGDRVRFLSGPFAEMIGSLERLDSHGRVMVLLNLLGRETGVKASAADLVPFR